jgi:hypothetical protein
MVTAPDATERITVTPSSASLSVSGTKQFTASSSGLRSGGITWSVLEGASGGTVDQTGFYTAPSSAGTYHVVAASAADPSVNSKAVVSVTAPSPPTPTPTPSPYHQQVLHMADWLLTNQDAAGALQDYHGGEICNEDSNMEYALIGLAAAYRASGDPRYLTGLENGIRWLAARQDMSATEWRGSWYYVYSCFPPYAPIPTSPGSGVTDVRGVDSTSALFVYLLYVQQQLSRSDVLVTQLAPNARAALDFILAHNMDADGFTWSSWQLVNGTWTLWKYKYAADQGDAYLGLAAGGLLYDGADRTYGNAADRIAQNIEATFFDARRARYAEGVDAGGLDWNAEFDATFPQGYLPWIFGASANNLASYRWLLNGVQPDGSLVLFTGDPGYSLSADLLAMAAAANGEPAPTASIDWLLRVAYDTNGAVRDTAAPRSDEISNVAAFTIVALLGQRPFSW